MKQGKLVSNLCHFLNSWSLGSVLMKCSFEVENPYLYTHSCSFQLVFIAVKICKPTNKLASKWTVRQRSSRRKFF
jgi:hypothetical protein